jgi:phage protein D
MRPTFQITAAGSDITGDISGRLVALEITDTVDETSDGLTMTLEDAAGTLALPSSGAKLEVAIGYDGNNQRVGSFVVDEVQVEGPPDIVTVTASSTPFVNDRGGGGQASFTSRKSRSFEGKTLGEIVRTVASDCGLTPAVDSELASVTVPYVEQVDESDANLLIRLARRFGGVLKPADGRLVLASEAGGRSVSGQSLEITLTPAEITSWRVKIGGKNQGITKVKAKRHDYQAADVEEIEVEVADDQFGLPTGGGDASGDLLPPP